MVKLENIIFQFASEKKLLAGITSAEPFEELRPVLLKTQKSLRGFVEQEIEKRIDPHLTMPKVQSIIAIAIPYDKQIEEQYPSGLRGNFSVGAVGIDYHVILKEYLEELEDRLQQENPLIECISFVDTGPLVDRYVAVRAGIGTIGRNGCLHTKKFGSMVFLGYLLTSVLLQTNLPLQGSCSQCGKCFVACPSGALQKNGFVMEQCISYLTQTKGILSREHMKTIGRQLYGCDVCQKICPDNNKLEPKEIVSSEEAMPYIETILNMSNQEFRNTIGKTAAGWRGKKIIQRNAVIVLGNLGQKDGLILLGQALQDQRPLIRHTAVRSIWNLGFAEGIFLLKEAEQKETEWEILNDIEKAILFLQEKEGEKHGLLEFQRPARERTGGND